MPDTASRKNLREPHRRLLIARLLCAILFAAFASGSLLGGSLLGGSSLKADDAEEQWIWWSDDGSEPPAESRFFRKTFDLKAPRRGKLTITCDNLYVVFLNNERVGNDREWTTIESIDVSRQLRSGKNVLAVRATNEAPGAAGLVARLTVEEKDGSKVEVPTDATWKSADRPLPGWRNIECDESNWVSPRVLGPISTTAPWKDRLRKPLGFDPQRFSVPPGFEIQPVADHAQTGTLVSMTFNQEGEILASVERGPILRLRDSDGDGTFDDVSTFCDKVSFCQGMLVLEDGVLAIGNGPGGTAMYRLTDEDGDGDAESVQTVLQFTAGMQDHGPHVPILGRDGFIYVLTGNFVTTTVPYAETSPHHDFYEGDLVRPRYEDSGGHAVGKLVPGGKVLRTDAQGSFVEIVCAGFRNPYDIAFNHQGELFTFDADMEFDDGTPWYRPTRINHVVAGGDYGWRSGWAKWPTYYPDTLPPVLDIGRGSPTGVVFYDHHALPEQYRDAMFICDWAGGRILAVTLDPLGASYSAHSEQFVEGRPLNVTDIEVGPEGHLYFTTGGRNTNGGIYRVVYTGTLETPEEPSGVMRAVRQPQLDSAPARKAIRAIQAEAGQSWQPGLLAIAGDVSAKAIDRVRAIELLQMFGPAPSPELLTLLAADEQLPVRAKAIELLGLHPGAEVAATLIRALDDPQPAIRRKACEALVRSGQQAPAEKLLSMLADEDRFVAWAARRSLEELPPDVWRQQVLDSDDPQVFLRGAIALLLLRPEKPTVQAILARCREGIARQATKLETATAPASESASETDTVAASAPGQASAASPETTPSSEITPLADWLRVIELCLLQCEPDASQQADWIARLNPLYPFQAASDLDAASGDAPQEEATSGIAPGNLAPGGLAHSASTPSEAAAANRELVRLLVYIEAPDLPQRMVAVLESDLPEVEKLHAAIHATRVQQGWDTTRRLALLRFFDQTQGSLQGRTAEGFVRTPMRQFLESASPAERDELLTDAGAMPTVAQMLLELLPEKVSESQVEALIRLDDRLNEHDDSTKRAARAKLLEALASTPDPRAQGYLHQVFESTPSRRQDVARAVAKFAEVTGRREIDWQLLVRSLTVVEGSDARDVLRSLKQFNQRATKPQWIRQVILLGLQLDQRGGNDALAVLRHWTDQDFKSEANTPQARLAPWQAWFREAHPELPDPSLPVVPPTAKWTYDQLLGLLNGGTPVGDPQRGRLAFEKAQCIKCHRQGTIGEAIGPDLTTVSRRFQKKEILASVLFPSQVISEQFASFTVVTDDGRTVTGMVGPSGPDAVVVLQSDGQKLIIPKDQIEETVPSKLSSMPQGLLDPLTIQEIADLFAFLMSGP